jgi:pyridoxal phosphate enzyme (YggS family)
MSEATSTDFSERLREVRERIAAAAERSGRNPDEVTLIAVSKTHPAAAVAEAMSAGVTDFGENRVQEGVAKSAEVAANSGNAPSTWHLIGHLQTNKVRDAVGAFAILHSVDSERLLRAISNACSTPIKVLIEVNVAAEPQKHGIAPAELSGLLAVAGELPNLDVRGQMTVAPLAHDPESVRPVFRELRELSQRHNLPELSMGMTNDYEVAIEEGATFVRVGRALFGERS